MTSLLHITELEVLPNFRLRLKFSDGAAGTVDISRELTGEIFSKLNEVAIFNSATIKYGTVVWDGDIDIAVEYLRERIN